MFVQSCCDRFPFVVLDDDGDGRVDEDCAGKCLTFLFVDHFGVIYIYQWHI